MSMEEKNCCSDKRPAGGFLSGLFYGVIPHFGCMLFIVLTVLGAATASSFLRPLLVNRYFFHSLVALSLILATFSAVLYLRKFGFLSFQVAAKKWKYLLTLYAMVVAVNLFLFLVVFPYTANLKTNVLANSNAAFNYDITKITLSVDIPCSGHAILVTEEIRKLKGVEDVGFRLPNLFDVYFNPKETSAGTIMSLGIFREFKVEKLFN